MAYMNQEKKAALAPGIKKVLKKYGMKGTLSVRNHSTLVLTVKSGKIDFQFKDGQRGVDVNVYHIANHYQDRPKAKAFLEEVYAAMQVGNYDNSDPMTDYFCVGWYSNIHIGKWNKPYVVV